MSAHPPESWTTGQQRVGEVLWDAVFDSDEVVALVNNPRHLAAIAAARDLLAALERLADNAEGRNLRGQTQETALRQALAEARAAIAKARGSK